MLDAQNDRIAYSWIPSNITLEDAITTTLVLRNMVTDEEHIIDTGILFDDLALSPNGQYLASTHRNDREAIMSELRLYDLARPGSSQTLGNPLIPDTVVKPWQTNEYLSTYIYAWSPDSAYVLVLTASSADEQSHQREALIFHTVDGKLVETVTLPNETGSLRLTNDARVVMVTYQEEAASLNLYNAKTQSFYQPIPLGAQTPIIVYVPES